MSGKFSAVLAIAFLIATTGFASAVAKTHRQDQYHSYNYRDSYYDRTYWNAVAPHGTSAWQPDPYAGTIWDGVAPY
jgi:hypothetical protein